MKKILYASIFTALVFASCNKEPQPLSKEQVHQRTDSIIKFRINESNEEARIDLERRIKIEVKVKADSIVNAKLTQPAKNTAGIKNVAQPKTVTQPKKSLFK